MWIVNGADDHLDVIDVLAARAVAQLVQRGLADVHSDGAASRRNNARNWKSKGALSGAYVANQRTWLGAEQTEQVGNTVLALELGTGLLSEYNLYLAGTEQRDEERGCEVAMRLLHTTRERHSR